MTLVLPSLREWIVAIRRGDAWSFARESGGRTLPGWVLTIEAPIISLLMATW